MGQTMGNLLGFKISFAGHKIGVFLSDRLENVNYHRYCLPPRLQKILEQDRLSDCLYYSFCLEAAVLLEEAPYRIILDKFVCGICFRRHNGLVNNNSSRSLKRWYYDHLSKSAIGIRPFKIPVPVLNGRSRNQSLSKRVIDHEVDFGSFPYLSLLTPNPKEAIRQFRRLVEKTQRPARLLAVFSDLNDEEVEVSRYCAV